MNASCRSPLKNKKPCAREFGSLYIQLTETNLVQLSKIHYENSKLRKRIRVPIAILSSSERKVLREWLDKTEAYINEQGK